MIISFIFENQHYSIICNLKSKQHHNPSEEIDWMCRYDLSLSTCWTRDTQTQQQQAPGEREKPWSTNAMQISTITSKQGIPHSTNITTHHHTMKQTLPDHFCFCQPTPGHASDQNNLSCTRKSSTKWVKDWLKWSERTQYLKGLVIR